MQYACNLWYPIFWVIWNVFCLERIVDWILKFVDEWIKGWFAWIDAWWMRINENQDEQIEDEWENKKKHFKKYFHDFLMIWKNRGYL